MTPELQAISERLDEMEKQVAHLAAIVTEHSDTERTVTARGFVVTDSRGQRRAELSTLRLQHGEESPGLRLLDAQGKLSASLGSRDEVRNGPVGPWLELYSPEGKCVVAVDAGKEGPTIRLLDSTGKTRVVLNVSPSGELCPMVTEKYA